MKWVLSVALFWLGMVPASFGFDHSHKAFDDLLKKHMDDKGFVRYGAWKKDAAPLEAYLKTLEGVDKKTFASFSVNDQKAFLVNAYNAFTIKLILDNYPVKSIKKIGGLFTKPWSIEFFSILEGDIKSLDPIEHVYLRKKAEYKDPRIHAAVNCASISCPRLMKDAFVGSKIDAQLDEATKAWIADSTRNQFDGAGKTIKISKIFDWFEEDFGGNDEGVLAFIRKYGDEKAQKSAIKGADIDYLDYDWNLNESK